MSEWIDGGYKVGEKIRTTEGTQCVLTVSLGSLGWMAKEVKRGRDTILLFCSEVYEKSIASKTKHAAK